MRRWGEELFENLLGFVPTRCVRAPEFFFFFFYDSSITGPEGRRVQVILLDTRFFFFFFPLLSFSGRI